jgi:hypothetical protein
MKVFIFAGMFLCAMSTADAVSRIEAPPSTPPVESAVYVVTDKLDPDNSGEEEWRREGSTIGIYSDGKFVAVIRQSNGGRSETTAAVGAAFYTAFLFPLSPKALPDKSLIKGSFVTIDRASRKTASCDMTAEVHRTADSVTITYEIKNENLTIKHIVTYRNSSNLPEGIEHITTERGTITEHVLKTRRP